VVNNEERRIRQGETLGKGVFFCLGGNIFSHWRKRREEEWRLCIYFCAYKLEDFHRGHLLLGILGSRARKP
jgi:hypothetical protein